MAPLRTHSGRRLNGAQALERINQIVALKRAGLTLAQIQRLIARRPLDLSRLIDAQLEALAARQSEIAEAKALLLSVKSRIDRGEPVDVATFCSLIRQGDAVMEHENWKVVADRYFTPDEQAHWAERMRDVPAGFDHEAYNRQWAELGTRIAAALPLDPASPQAQALYDEWQALLAPFKAVATSEMMAGATELYSRMDEWKGVPAAALRDGGVELHPGRRQGAGGVVKGDSHFSHRRIRSGPAVRKSDCPCPFTNAPG